MKSNRKYHKTKYYQYAIFMVSLIFVEQSIASNWNIVPSLYSSVSYNDNVYLSVQGQETRDLITQINPHVSINKEGGRGYLELDYTMQNILYSSESAFNDTFHLLNARAGTELLPDLLYVDASAGHTQQVTSRDEAVPADNVTISTNRTDLDLFSISPYTRYQFGRQAVGELRYKKTWYQYSDPGPSDSNERELSIDLRNINPQQNILWALTYDHQKIIPDTGFESRLEEELLDLSIKLTPKVRFLAAGGYEKNEYDNAAGMLVEKGSIWNAGLRLTPGYGITMMGRYGERFFGKTKSYSITKSGRRWHLGASYSEELRTSAGILLNNQAENEIDSGIVQPGDPLPGTEAFLNEQLTVNIARRYSKTEIVVAYYDRDRTYRVSNNREHVYGGDADIYWMFLARTKLNLGYSVEKENIIINNSTDKISEGRLGIERQVREHINLSLNYRHYNRKTNNPLRFDFSQNQYSAALSIVF